MKYEIELSDETLEKIVDTELRILLEILEADPPTHPDDVAYCKKMIPALKIVLEGGHARRRVSSRCG